MGHKQNDAVKCPRKIYLRIVIDYKIIIKCEITTMLQIRHERGTPLPNNHYFKYKKYYFIYL